MFLGRKIAKEGYMILDSEGYIVSTKKYILNNPDLFSYEKYMRIGSTVYHVYKFRD